MNDKELFVTSGFIALVKTLDVNARTSWGKMNAQQMVEHVKNFYKVSNGSMRFKLVTPEEQLPKFKAFILSDKEFRPETKAPMLPEDPFPLEYASMEEAIAQLETETAAFVEYFKNDPSVATQDPVFGDLNYEEWTLLHYKHVLHHAKQFGLM